MVNVVSTVMMAMEIRKIQWNDFLAAMLCIIGCVMLVHPPFLFGDYTRHSKIVTNSMCEVILNVSSILINILVFMTAHVYALVCTLCTVSIDHILS